MWRAVFAFTFVDNVLSLEEQQLLQSYLSQVPFTVDQLATLRQDLLHPQDVETLYKQISDSEDKKRFCVLCRAIVWCEGDMNAQERKILQKVSCLKSDPDEILVSTRNHPHINDYYQSYAKTGMVGLMKARPLVQLQV